MTMANIKLLQPTTLDEAVTLLSADGDRAKIVGGGTALVIMLKNRLISPSSLVSLGRLPDLRYIRYDPANGLRIGGLTSIRDAEQSGLLREKQPALASALSKVGNIRVRNAATVAGNLSEADYASDPPCMLVALRGKVKTVSLRGEREMPLTEFFTGFYETALSPDEILTELIVPDLPPNSRSVYLKYVSRSSEDRPCVGMAAVLENQPDGTCKELRLVAGAVAETPQEFQSAGAMARGQHLTDKLIDQIADACSNGVEPISDLRGSAWYRKKIIRVMARRAMQEVTATH